MQRSGQSFETLQRQQRTVDHQAGGDAQSALSREIHRRDWIEELVFIEGPDNEIYSVALKCAPQNLARFEPALNGVLASWTLPQPEPPADSGRRSARNALRRQPHRPACIESP